MKKTSTQATNNVLKATRVIAYTGVFCALVTAATLLGVSTAQFYFNVGDTVILISAALLGPVPAMVAGGLGSFFADLAVYPATMVFTLFIKGAEGLLAGILFQAVFKYAKRNSQRAISGALSMLLSSLFMATGYFACQSLFYGTYAAAVVALPMDIAQAALSTSLATLILFAAKLIRFRSKIGIVKEYYTPAPAYVREAPYSERCK